MTGWRAVVPIKQGTFGKSRLSPVLDAQARDDLVRRMADHVLQTLAEVAALAQIDVLSPLPYPGWHGAWSRDRGRSRAWATAGSCWRSAWRTRGCC